jgi:virginiamycin A acetyltransferase
MTMPARRGARALIKSAVDSVALALVAPAAATAWLERRLSPHREGLFGFWAQVFAIVPGIAGTFLRRAYYRTTLDECEGDFYVGFGSMFTHRGARVEDGVFVGAYALIGCASLRRGCLIGSRASLLSGGALHQMRPDGTWSPTEPERLQQIEVGEHAWIGEAATVMADIGPRAMVAAGSVVSAAVPERIMVAGNPARFVRVVEPPPPAPQPIPGPGIAYVTGIHIVD